jgi:hypothetical protein
MEKELNIKIVGGTRESIVNALKEAFDLVKGGVDVTTIDNTQKHYATTVELLDTSTIDELAEDGLPWPQQE